MGRLDIFPAVATGLPHSGQGGQGIPLSPFRPGGNFYPARAPRAIHPSRPFKGDVA